MNTEQNYVGRGNSASTSPQAAKNRAKSTKIANRRQVDSSKKISDLLAEQAKIQGELSLLVCEYSRTTNAIPAINEMMSAYVSGANSIPLQEEQLNVRTVLALSTFLVKVNALAEILGILERAIERAEAEGGAMHNE
ncbi:hypothetical protein GCM10028808_73150 [Spirosoma migulaei]